MDTQDDEAYVKGPDVKRRSDFNESQRDLSCYVKISHGKKDQDLWGISSGGFGPRGHGPYLWRIYYDLKEDYEERILCKVNFNFKNFLMMIKVLKEVVPDNFIGIGNFELKAKSFIMNFEKI